MAHAPSELPLHQYFYTVGLPDFLGFPDFLLAGPAATRIGTMIQLAVRMLQDRAGLTGDDGWPTVGNRFKGMFKEGYDVRFAQIDPAEARRFMPLSYDLSILRTSALNPLCLQLQLPDDHNRLPGDRGCCQRTILDQRLT